MQELTHYRNWVVTYLTNKIPLHPITGKNADVNDPSTWTDHTTAMAACHYNSALTPGFVLTNTPFACIDLDSYKTTDPGIIGLHKQLYEYFDTYSELSPQGGVHLWCKGSLPTGKKLPSQYIEAYTTSRYITVTQQNINSKPIAERQVQLEELYKQIDLKQYSSSAHLTDSSPETESDEQVYMHAMNAINGRLFMDLWAGSYQHYYQSQSEADQALMNIIAYYTENKEQAARMFHQSELGRRKKAHQMSYLYHPKWGLVTKAWDQKLPQIKLNDIHHIIGNGLNNNAALNAIKVPMNGYVSEATQTARKVEMMPAFVQRDFSFDFSELPPGLVGDVAQFIYRNAVRPVREVAISGAIAFMAGICGRAYNISSTGLNVYMTILAPTGGGKEAAASGIERLVKYICDANAPEIEHFIGPADIASPQALVKHLKDNPCIVSHRGEMGFWINKLCNKFAKSNETSLRGLLLDLYTKSGHGQVMRGSIYADTAKNVSAIHAPALTLLGDSTPDRFYAALDEENVEEGLVSRFTIVECSMEKAPYNIHHDQIEPDKDMLLKLCRLVKMNYELNRIGRAQPIMEQPEAQQEHMRFEQECYRRTISPNGSEAKLYSRAHLKLLRLAGLIAVGINPDCPVVTPEIVEWARKFVVHGISRVALRFDSGEIGEVNMYFKQRKAIQSIIRKYLADGWKESLARTFSINLDMYKAKIVTLRYIQQHVAGYAAFRKSKVTSLDCRNVVHELVESGILIKLDMGKIRDSPRQGIAYYIHDVAALQVEREA